jgi:hypothetical protein
MKDGGSRSALLVVMASAMACAMGAFSPNGDGQGLASVVLVDSGGKTAARLFTDGLVLVTDPASRVVAPASIRAITSDDGRAASGLATWQSGGGVLFSSIDCSTGAHVYTGTGAGVRAATQVQTPSGIVLYVGGIGPPTTAAIRSVLYDSGCHAVTLRQNGLIPVDVTLNLTALFPPPLSFR